MILGLQVIAMFFSLIMIYIAYLHYRRGEINGLESIFWFGSWLGAILIVLFPSLFKTFSETIAVSRAFDLAVLGGFILVIPLVYLSYIRTKKMEKKFEKYIRDEALKGVKCERKQK